MSILASTAEYVVDEEFIHSGRIERFIGLINLTGCLCAKTKALTYRFSAFSAIFHSMKFVSAAGDHGVFGGGSGILRRMRVASTHTDYVDIPGGMIREIAGRRM